MEHFKDHPTWKMLEEGKQQLKQLLADIPRHHPFYNVVNEAFISLMKLQYTLENKLVAK